MLRASWTRGLAAAALVTGLAACGKGREAMESANTGGATQMQPAEYRIVLHSTWTREHHPFEYPSAGALTGPHFSGIIGATHNASYSLFADGRMPTPGLERLSEMGSHSPLDDEIRAAIAGGSAGALFETGPLRDFGDSVVTTVSVDAAHPMLSLVAMIAPSPDWFTGAAAVNLMENGAWVASRTLTLNAWDSGGDDGHTYKADDRDTNPKKPTMQAATRHFTMNGAAVPVATVTITKVTM